MATVIDFPTQPERGTRLDMHGAATGYDVESIERYIDRKRSHARPWPDPRDVRMTLDELLGQQGANSFSEWVGRID